MVTGNARLREPQRGPRARRSRPDDDDPGRRAARRPALRRRRGRGRRRQRLPLPRDQHAQTLAERAPLARVQRSPQHPQRRPPARAPSRARAPAAAPAGRRARRAARTGRRSQPWGAGLMARAAAASRSARHAGARPDSGARPLRIRGKDGAGSRRSRSCSCSRRSARRAERGFASRSPSRGLGTLQGPQLKAAQREPSRRISKRAPWRTIRSGSCQTTGSRIDTVTEW